MEKPEQDFQPSTKPRRPSWKKTIRKSLGCGLSGKSRDPIRVRSSISNPYPIDHAQEKVPAVADEVDLVQRRADKAHRDVLETLRKMTASSASASGEQPPRPRSDVVSALSSLASWGHGEGAASVSDMEEPEAELAPSPRPGPEAAQKQQQQHQLRRAVPGPQQPTPLPTLRALLYFTLERPNHGGFVRHYRHPLPLDLSTPRALDLSVRTLRGYLTERPRRFFSHFGHQHHSPRHDDDDDDVEKDEDTNNIAIVINAPQLFSQTSEVRGAVERTWGQRGGRPMARAWADAREEAFAPALVGLLRELAERRAVRWEAGTVDVCVVVRWMVAGRKGSWWDWDREEMDVRRVVGRGGERL